MIYGDRTFEEDETKYPDITASLQAGNLYGYCMGNPVMYYDKTGDSVTAATVIAGIGTIVASATIKGVIDGAISKVGGDSFKSGFVNGFTSTVVTEIGTALGTVINPGVGTAVGTIIGSSIGSALGSYISNNKRLTNEEKAKEAAKAAVTGIIGGVSSSLLEVCNKSSK